MSDENLKDPVVPLPAAPELKAGLSVGSGRYLLKKFLGQGGMGIVWLAQDSRLGEEVALKFLPGELRLDFSSLEDLRQETLKSHKLAHPNIIRIHDLVEVAGENPFISMEFVDGPTLSRHRVQSAARILEWEGLSDLVRQLCEALEYAHNEKVIHRDLKPANLMLDSRQRIKLADFGIARVVTDSMSRVTMRQGTSGTLVYMSPQQLDGRPSNPTDDIYSVGATLYELLTSKPPFYTGEIPHQIRYAEPTPIAQRLKELGIASQVPKVVENTVAACLKKNPADRPQSARQLGASLGLMESNPPSSKPGARVAKPPPEPAPPRQGRPVAKALGIIAGLGVITASAYYFGHTSSNLSTTQPRSSGSVAAPELPRTNTAVILPPPNPAPVVAAPPAIPSLAMVAPPTNPRPVPAKPPEDPTLLRNLELLKLIQADADSATNHEDRLRFLRELMTRSQPLLEQDPSQESIWLLRAAAAVDLNDADAGWKAGVQLKKLGADKSTDPAAIKTMAALDRKGWLGDYSPSQDWKNSPLAGVQAAAEQGNAPAQSELGERYYNGNGVVKDYTQAVKWYRKAAEQGFAMAEFGLGRVYEHGLGVGQDYIQAATWYRKAAEQGNAKAEVDLGVLYGTGRGVPKDDSQALQWYRKAAEQGNAAGEADLGVMYEFGRGVAQDYVEAVKWYRKAAEQGNPLGEADLGVMYEFGRGVPKDDTEALQWYRKAAEQGNAAGETDVGVMYQRGQGVPKDDSQALQWYRKAADQKYARAEYDMGWVYENGRGVAQDYGQAATWYRKAAEQGYAPAEVSLGLMYEKGQGVPKDDSQALQWYRKAAEQGDANGEANLGILYQKGQGVPMDDSQALQWYRKAAEQGYAAGEDDLGIMYENGRGVAQDFVQAATWYRKAAEQGYALGEVNLGWMYQNGRGVPKDDTTAVQWYRKAAEQGEPNGEANLGVMYQNGQGVPKDDSQALQWYRKAAEHGFAPGEYDLGTMYENGRGGVEKNITEAVAWYRKAAAQGNTNAQAALQRLGY
ncbi:MAG: protein kinase [Verrucomicrobiota bacterium]